MKFGQEDFIDSSSEEEEWASFYEGFDKNDRYWNPEDPPFEQIDKRGAVDEPDVLVTSDQNVQIIDKQSKMVKKFDRLVISEIG